MPADAEVCVGWCVWELRVPWVNSYVSFFPSFLVGLKSSKGDHYIHKRARETDTDSLEPIYIMLEHILKKCFGVSL